MKGNCLLSSSIIDSISFE